MIEFLLQPDNLLFSAALGLMFALGLIECGMLVTGLSGAADAILPDADPNVDLTMPDDHLQIDAPFLKVLDWLHIGRVPMLLLMVFFLTVFGLLGLIMQGLLSSVTGFMLPWYVAWVPVMFPSLPALRCFGKLYIRYMPGDETEAVSESTFIGRVARITVGTASRGHAAQARLHDQFGQAHYVMLEPDLDDEVFSAGTSVILVSRSGSVFRAILNTNPALQGAERENT